MDGNLKFSNPPGQSESGSYGNKGVLHTLQITIFVLPPTRQDLTQDHFIVGVMEGEVANEVTLVRCWT